MLSDPTKAEELIRQDVAILRQRLEMLEQERQRIDAETANVKATIEKWEAVLSDEREPSSDDWRNMDRAKVTQATNSLLSDKG